MLDTSKIPTVRVDGYYNHKTNCITRIPQHIDIELIDGLLHVYEGTTIYIPNGKKEDGSNKFDTYVLPNEIVINGNYTNLEGLILFFLDVTTKTGFQYRPLNLTYSGDSDPQTQGTTYYNTETNIINSNNINGKAYPVSLPICICNIKNNKIESIYQVFNGFGFIGSTVFITPGIEALIPDGIDGDGQLENIFYKSNSILMAKGLDGWHNHWYLHLSNPNTIIYHPYELYFSQENEPMPTGTTSFWYKPSTNTIFYTDDRGQTWNETKAITPFLDIIQDGDRIVSITPKQVYRDLDIETVKQKIKVVSELPTQPTAGVFYFVKE